MCDCDPCIMRWRRYLRGLPIRTAAMALFLFTVGTVFLIVGISELQTDPKNRALAMIILGSICFIPGSYATYTLYGAFQRWEGFRYEQVPSYDDD